MEYPWIYISVVVCTWLFKPGCRALPRLDQTEHRRTSTRVLFVQRVGGKWTVPTSAAHTKPAGRPVDVRNWCGHPATSTPGRATNIFVLLYSQA